MTHGFRNTLLTRLVLGSFLFSLSLPAAAQFTAKKFRPPVKNPTMVQTRPVVRQEPQRPFPYEEIQVTFTNPQDGVTLSGTLTYPFGKGPFPTVLLLAGSGPQDRDETFGPHKPLLVYSDRLTQKGFATLRYDKRGLSFSRADSRWPSLKEETQDAQAALEFLKGLSVVDPNRIGALGTSEGGLHSYRIASRSKDLAFIVLLGAPAMEGEAGLLLQHQLVWKAQGMGDRAIQNQLATEKIAIDIVKQEKDDHKAIGMIWNGVDVYKAKMSEEEKLELAQTLGTIGEWGTRLTWPYWRELTSLEPRKDLKKVQCPVLAIWGEKDLQAPANEHYHAAEAALKEGKNKDFRVLIFPGLNHALQPCVTCVPSEFWSIPETVSPEVLEAILDWIEKHSR